MKILNNHLKNNLLIYVSIKVPDLSEIKNDGPKHLIIMSFILTKTNCINK